MRDWGPEEAARSRGADTGQPALVLGNVDPDLPSPQRRFQRNLKPEREWSPASDGSSPQTPGFQPGRPRAGGRACGAPDPLKPARGRCCVHPCSHSHRKRGRHHQHSPLHSHRPRRPPGPSPQPARRVHSQPSGRSNNHAVNATGVHTCLRQDSAQLQSDTRSPSADTGVDTWLTGFSVPV